MPRDDFDRWIEEMPEPKLELLDGRLSVGNGAGNQRLLHHLLEGWGAQAALPMAPVELWWQALHQGFRPFHPPDPRKPASIWQAWAGQLSYAPSLAPAGPMLEAKHRVARESLTMGLFGIAQDHGFAHVSGRDVIMRLGDDALTPDVFAVGPEHCKWLNGHYLDGPADLVIEILLRGHEAYDREIKRERYGAGSVREFWLVDPEAQTVEFLQWTGQGYGPCVLGSDGTHRPLAFPGLSFRPSKLWERDSHWDRGPNPFSVTSPMPRVQKGFAQGGVAWGDLEFDPQPALTPRATTFDQFASWAPEAKFECIDGKPWVGGSHGSRNVLGLLLRTEGLTKAVTVLHPRDWIGALAQMEEDRAADAGRRDHWWQIAGDAAALLRQKFHFGRLVVIGDLVRPQPLNVWSEITLVAFDLSKKQDTWEGSRFLYEKYRDEPDIKLIRFEHANRAEQEAVPREGVEL